jgi:hypothetical protein
MEERDSIDFKHGSNIRDVAQPVSIIIPAKADGLRRDDR